MKLTISIKKIPKSLTAIDQKKLNKAVKAGGLRYLEMIHEWIGQGKAFKPRTGNLQQSINIRFEPFKTIISANIKYAPYVEFGTKEHIILPRSRQALKIPTQAGFIFRKSAMHPGTKPKPYFFADMQNRRREVTKAMAGVLWDDT